MRIGGFRHKGLSRLYHEDDARGLPVGIIDKLRELLFALESASDLEEIERFPGWRLHRLKGSLAGCWSLRVTGNRRLIFHYSAKDNTASDIDLTDYH